jgi:hypothetical protein
MADKLRLAIARVYRTGSSKGYHHHTQKTCHVVAFPGLRFDSWPVRMLSMGHFFTDIWLLSNHPCTRPSSWLPEKILGVKKGTDTHCVLRETGQMPIFFYWFRCTIRSWSSLLSSNNPHLEKIVRADLLLANRSDTWTYQVLHALQDLPTSQQFLNAIRSRQTQSRTVWTHSTWTYHWGLERSWHFDTTWSSPFQRNYEDTFWCTFGEYSWMVGWQKKNSKACVASLPSLGHSQQPQPRTFLPSPFWPRLSGPNNASWQE